MRNESGSTPHGMHPGRKKRKKRGRKGVGSLWEDRGNLEIVDSEPPNAAGPSNLAFPASFSNLPAGGPAPPAMESSVEWVRLALAGWEFPLRAMESALRASKSTFLGPRETFRGNLETPAGTGRRLTLKCQMSAWLFLESAPKFVFIAGVNQPMTRKRRPRAGRGPRLTGTSRCRL